MIHSLALNSGIPKFEGNKTLKTKRTSVIKKKTKYRNRKVKEGTMERRH